MDTEFVWLFKSHFNDNRQFTPDEYSQFSPPKKVTFILRVQLKAFFFSCYLFKLPLGLHRIKQRVDVLIKMYLLFDDKAAKIPKQFNCGRAGDEIAATRS